MKRKNKSISLALIGLLTSALSSKQIHAMDQVAIAANNAIGLIGAGVSWHVIAGQLFSSQAPAEAAAIEPVDPYVGLVDQENKAQLFGQLQSAATVFKEASIGQVGMNLFEKEQCQEALQLALYGKTEELQKLLTTDAHTNTTNIVNFDQTALMKAAFHGHTTTVNLLLDAKANVNAVDEWGKTALIYAAYHGHSATVHALLDAQADVNAVDNDGKTALKHACSGLMYLPLNACLIGIAKILKDAGAH